MIAVVGSLLGGYAQFPKWIFIFVLVIVILYILNKDSIDKTFKK